jgi:hypothetical protein
MRNAGYNEAFYHLLDLDKIGRPRSLGYYFGLYKGPHAGAQRSDGAWEVLRSGLPGGWGKATARETVDLAAISHLYKLRVDDLRNTVAQLHSLESALIFLNDVKPTLRIDF